ncbi:MAG: non-homologous end-joining DNA ligase, partial [Patescibacteria group bacterium]
MKYAPMLCRLVDKPFKSKEWVFEHKIDGMRIIAIKTGEKVRLLTRNNKDKAKQFPEIVAAIKKLSPKQLVLDGEITAFRKGISSFQALQPRIGQTDPHEIAKLTKRVPAAYLAFDLLNYDGKNWETKSLLERKEKLRLLFKPHPPYILGVLYYLAPLSSDGISLFKKAKQKHWEGIIGKRIDSRYQEGRRSGDWVKIKTHNQQEFVIGAYTPGQGKTKTTFGAVLVGYYRGKKLVYAGKVGTGFTDTERGELKQKFLKLKSTKSPFVDISKKSSPAEGQPRRLGEEVRRGGSMVTRNETVIWLKPRLVGEFAFGEWTKDNILRQPVYMG